MKKKKILLLSDDLRMHSGIATQSKEFVMGTLDKYDWDYFDWPNQSFVYLFG